MLSLAINAENNYAYSNSSKTTCSEKIKIKPSSSSPDFYFFPEKLTVEDETGHEVMSVSKTFLEQDFSNEEADMEKRISKNIECGESKLSYFKDINFDGYKDMILSMHSGILINQVGWVWLYNPAKNIFEYSKEYEDKIFSNVEINPKKKYLLTYSDCCAGTEHNIHIYTWDKEGIKELKSCEFKADETGFTPDGAMTKASINNLQDCRDMFGQPIEQDGFIKMLPKK